MQNQVSRNPSLGGISLKRRAVVSSQESWVRLEDARFGDQSLLVVAPTVEGVDLIAWAANNREFIESNLLKRGAILFRDFGVGSVENFQGFVRRAAGEPMHYHDQATPRRQVSDRIYSSTDYPPEHHIELHNESSYAFTWPMRIVFFCVLAATEGGETPIADSRNVFNRISPKVRDRFIQKKVMYVRNFNEVYGLSWQTVFQAKTLEEAAVHCRDNHIEMIWGENGRLRTQQIREAVAKHPVTGELVWFNQSTAFHLSTLPLPIRQALIEQVGEENVPKNVYYGDGSPIEEDVLDEVRQAYKEETVVFQWRSGDVIMLDNMLMAHGRRPFGGARKVVAGMAQPMTWDGI